MSQATFLDTWDQASLSPSLRDPCQTKHGGNPNSQAAFASLTPNLSAACQAVFDAIQEQPGSTIHDVCRRLGKLPNEVSGRITTLKARKAIKVVGTGVSPTGNRCDAYEVVQQAS